MARRLQGEKIGAEMRFASVVVAATALLIGPHATAAIVEAGGAARPDATRPVSALERLPIDIRPEAYTTPTAAFGPTTGDHVSLTAATAWHTAGFDGTGIRVGVIDFFDITSYWDEKENGPIPVANVNARCIASGADCSDEMFDGLDLGGEDHGVAVVELIKDMAPGAEIFLGTALTLDDYRSLIDWFASNGVSVLNRSLGSRYDGPGDGRGALSEIALYANQRGITWVNSGGNNGIGRYYRQPVRLLGQNVAFGPSGSDIFLKYNGCASPGGVRWANDWDVSPSQRSDYEIIIWDSPRDNPSDGIVRATADADQSGGAPPIENFDVSFCPSGSPSTRSLYLEIRYKGGDTNGDVLEILDYGAGFANYTQSDYSASTSIVDSTASGVLAVGAIDPPGSGQAGSYSSRGPTNDGRVAPDLSATSGVSSSVLGATFSGTSASAAVVTGGVALLIDGGLARDPGSVGSLVRHLSVDRGPPGADNTYGSGEFVLPAPPTPIAETPSRLVALDVPVRLLDTRPASQVGPPELSGVFTEGDIRDLPVLGRAGIPASDDVVAIAVNLTAVDFDGPGFVQALPTLSAEVGGFSNVNIDTAGQTRANFGIVPIGADGAISLYAVGSGHLIIDVLGYYIAAPDGATGGRLVQLATPQRVLDTRDGTAVSSFETRQVPWPSGVDPSVAGGLVVTITATDATQPGWVQLHPSARGDAVGSTSTVNVMPGETAANTAVVPAGGQGVALTGFFGTGTGHVVVDVVGYISSELSAPADAGRFVPLGPSRAFDSRTSTGLLRAQQVVDIDIAGVPDTASSVIWNLAAVDVLHPGFGRGWAADQTEPLSSAFNWSRAGEVRATAAVTAGPGGRLKISMHDGSGQPGAATGHVVADVFGYFT
jgi:hypothetical protein